MALDRLQQLPRPRFSWLAVFFFHQSLTPGSGCSSCLDSALHSLTALSSESNARVRPPQPGWLSSNKDWANMLVRDTANFSTQGSPFPFSRGFGWCHGHSWAKGLFESADSKDEEGNSENAYALSSRAHKERPMSVFSPINEPPKTSPQYLLLRSRTFCLLHFQLPQLRILSRHLSICIHCPHAARHADVLLTLET